MQRWLVAAWCVAVLSLGACSGDASSADPPPAPPTTGPPPASVTPQVRETPEAFVRRWVRLSNRMQNTGETTHYLALSQGCRPCEEVAAQVEGYFDAGGYVRTDGWAVDAIRVFAPGPDHRVTATVDITSSPTVFAASAGAPEQRLEGGSIIELMTLDPHEKSWMLVDLEQQAQ